MKYSPGYKMINVHPQLTVPEGTYFQKNWNIEEAKRSAAIGLLWILLKEEKLKKVDLDWAPPTVTVPSAAAQGQQRSKRDRAVRRKAQHRATEATPLSPTDPEGDSSDPPRRRPPADERRRQVERPGGESSAGLIVFNIPDELCEHCQRCFELCQEHFGCSCEPEPVSKPRDCVICKGREHVSNTVATVFE